MHNLHTFFHIHVEKEGGYPRLFGRWEAGKYSKC